MKKWVAIPLAILLGILSLNSVADADEARIKAAKKEGTIVVYHSINRKVLSKMAKEFTKRYGVKVKWTRKGSGGIARMISAEKMAGVLKCDIVSNGDATRFINWKKQNTLMNYVTPNTPSFMKLMVDPDGASVPARITYGAIGYNAKKVSKQEAPKSWKDLLDPKWKGRIGVIDPRKSGPGRWWLVTMVKKFGWDFIEKLAKNRPLLLKSSSTAALSLLGGEVDLTAPGSEHHLTRRIKRGEPLGVVYPKEGLVIKASRTAICANAPHPNAAKLWIDYETSFDGQTLIGKAGGYLPVRVDVTPHFKRPQGALKKVIPITEEYAHKNMNKYMKRFEKIMRRGK
jgi:iron(III) transport system substrate-binding protein